MLSPEYYESCAELILQQYADLEDAILRDIIRRLMKKGFVTDTAKWQAEMLQEAGLLYNDIVQEISDRTDACAEQVKTLFEDAGVETVQIDNEVYREAGLVPVDIRQSPSMRQALEAGYRKTLGQLDNLTKTMPSAGQRLYINACNQAYMKVTSGAFSYQQAIMQAVRDTAASGLKIIQYDSGHADRVETAVRRAVLTGVGQTCREIGRMNAEENGCSLMEITAHSGARPEHAVWQGQLVDLTGRRAGEVVDGKRVLSLSAIGYGQITGFGGVNCRHDWYPYFEGISVPNYTAAQLKDLDARNISYNGEMYTQYEISQMQRAGERKVRAWKRRCITSQEAVKGAPDEATKAAAQAEYSKSAVKLKSAEQKLKDFCNTTGQDRDRFREQVLGFSRSEARRAVQTAKKAASGELTSGAKSDKMKDSGNVFHAITDNSYRKLQNISVFNDSRDEKMVTAMKHVLDNVKKEKVGTESLAIYDYKTFELVNESIADNADGTVKRLISERPYISIHNHPSGETFSSADMQVLCDDKKCMIIAVVGNNGNAYILEKTEKFNSTGLFEYIMKKKYGFEKYDSEEEFIAGCEKYGVRYYKRAN